MRLSLTKESLRFYLELLQEMPERFEQPRAILRRIADEEQQHLRNLVANKTTLTAGL